MRIGCMVRGSFQDVLGHVSYHPKHHDTKYGIRTIAAPAAGVDVHTSLRLFVTGFAPRASPEGSGELGRRGGV